MLSGPGLFEDKGNPVHRSRQRLRPGADLFELEAVLVALIEQVLLQRVA